jgi:hypothetical protein
MASKPVKVVPAIGALRSCYQPCGWYRSEGPRPLGNPPAAAYAR